MHLFIHQAFPEYLPFARYYTGFWVLSCEPKQTRFNELHGLGKQKIPCVNPMLLQPWPSSPVPCADVPLAQPKVPGDHQIPFRRGEMGPLPSSVLCSHLGPKAVRVLVVGASAGLLPASDLALLTYSIKDHRQSKLLALPEK